MYTVMLVVSEDPEVWTPAIVYDNFGKDPFLASQLNEARKMRAEMSETHPLSKYAVYKLVEVK